MSRKSDQQRIEKFFSGLKKELKATAGIVASSYAKSASKSIMEEWGEILARNIELGLISPSLARQTEINRKSRGNPTYPPLLETGEYVEYIEFRWTSMPSKNYDLLEVGVFDNSTKIGHDDSITPYKLGLMNEYGFNGLFEGENGESYFVNIPARPHFRESALDVGYEFNRIARDSFSQVQIAQGREKRSIKSKGLSGTLLWDLSAAAPDRYSGSGPTKTSVGRLITTRSGNLEFIWTLKNW